MRAEFYDVHVSLGQGQVKVKVLYLLKIAFIVNTMKRKVVV